MSVFLDFPSKIEKSAEQSFVVMSEQLPPRVFSMVLLSSWNTENVSHTSKKELKRRVFASYKEKKLKSDCQAYLLIFE